ncbi:AMP-binding protein [Actinomadura fulvescens]|uniref:(2,3-dihydroxybenzoyl)adenylate synthase n=1 Tax=Actinomadura fulvescens TaxID=46160 RepID=A0ABP6C422_9ACTN
MATTTREPSSAGTVPWPAEAAARYTAEGYWEGRSLGEHLYTAADAAPEAICLVDGERRLSFREFTERADGAAVRLRALGLRADDRVVVQLPNCWELVVVTVACFRLGVIPVMALPANRRREISAVAALAQARALIVPDALKGFDHQAMAWEVAAETAAVEHVLVAGPGVRGAGVDLRALCEPAADPAAARRELDDHAPEGAAVATVLLSGGTTGLPKLIARTHNDYAYMIKRAARLCGFGPDTVLLAVLPLGHGFPMAGPGVLGTLLSGGRVVLAPSPAPERAFAAIERERITVTSLVPAAVQRWLEYRATGPGAGTDLGSLRLLQSGGARLPDPVAREVGPALGCTLQQVYGMSEGLLCFTRPDDPEHVVCRTQGRPICPDDELLIVDEQGEPVAPGQPGTLLTRGPYTPRGYYRGGELNGHAFVGDGWYRTGDIVSLRPDGNLIVQGRDKDVINRGGEKIAAEEVEEFAYQVDGVRRAAAVALPDPELGERVCLCVVVRPGTSITLADVRALMERAGVARFKLPERLVVVDELPTTNVGKIDKRALRSAIGQDLATDRAGHAG